MLGVEEESPTRNNLIPLQGEMDKQELDVDDEKAEVEEKSPHPSSSNPNTSGAKGNVIPENEELFDKKRRWGRGISIYRLVNGKF